MVFTKIRGMLGLAYLEKAGNLYCNKLIDITEATIDVLDDRIVIEGEEKKREFLFEEIAYIDFAKTETKETSVYFITEKKKEKWSFVFRQNLPRTIVQFYGKLFPHQPKINKWTVLFVNNSVSLRKYSQEEGIYQLVDDSVSMRLIKIEESIVLRVYKEYEIIRKGDLILNYSDFYVDQETCSFSWSVSAGSHFNPTLDVFRIVFSSLPTLFSFISSFVSASTKEETEYIGKMEIDNYNGPEDNNSEEESEESEEESPSESSDDKIALQRKTRKPVKDQKPKSGNIFGGRDKEKNKALALSTENTFISRGSSIGIFQNNDDDLSYRGTIHAESTKRDKVSPNKMVVTRSQDALVVSDMNNSETIHKIDLATGKVAETWSADNEVKDFFTSSKDSHGISSSDGFIGISTNKLFKIDPRVSNIIEGKSYSTNTKFRSGDSTKDGYFAIGSDTGNIRLYDSLDKRAKTLLPGLGDPVLGVFISPSGKYLVGTCKTYLMLVVTENESVSGFKKSLGEKKPVPKKLIVRPEHLHYFGGSVNFTNASISTDTEEKYVIVSTGEWIVVWDMQKVLKGNVFSYSIKKNDHSVVSNSFMPGDSNKIVVAMDDDLEMITRMSLKKTKNLTK